MGTFNPSNIQHVTISPAPTIGRVTMRLNNFAVDEDHNGCGVAWQIQDANNYYCLAFTTRQEMNDYTDWNLCKVIGGVSTELGKHNFFNMDTPLTGTLEIIFDLGEIIVTHIESGGTITEIFNVTDDTFAEPLADIGMMVASSTENFTYEFLFDSFAVYDDVSTNTGAKVELIATATVAPLGQLTTVEGVVSLVATAEANANAKLGEETTDIVKYRFASCDQNLVEPQTWLAAENTPIAVLGDTAFRLRWLLQNNNAFATSPLKAEIQTRSVSYTGEASEWMALNDSSWIAKHDADYNTTQNLREIKYIWANHVGATVPITQLYGAGDLFYRAETDDIIAFGATSSDILSADNAKVIVKVIDPDTYQSTQNLVIKELDLEFRAFWGASFIFCGNGDILLIGQWDVSGTAWDVMRYYRSTDGGNTWGAVNIIDDTATDDAGGYLSLSHFAEGNDVYVTYGTHYLHSADNGLTWDTKQAIYDAFYTSFPYNATFADMTLFSYVSNTIYATARISGTWYDPPASIGVTFIPDVERGTKSGISLCSAIASDGKVSVAYLQIITPAVINGFLKVGIVTTRYDRATNTFETANPVLLGDFFPWILGPSSGSCNYGTFSTHVIDYNITTDVMLIAIYQNDNETNGGPDYDSTRFGTIRYVAIDFSTPVPTRVDVGRYMHIGAQSDFLLHRINEGAGYNIGVVFPSDVSANINSYLELRYTFLPSKESGWLTSDPTTQQLGSGTYLTNNHGFFTDGVYPAKKGRYDVAPIPANQELEIETALTVQGTGIDANVEYQFRLAPPTEPSGYWDYKYTLPTGVNFNATGVIPAEWTNDATYPWTSGATPADHPPGFDYRLITFYPDSNYFASTFIVDDTLKVYGSMTCTIYAGHDYEFLNIRYLCEVFENNDPYPNSAPMGIRVPISNGSFSPKYLDFGNDYNNGTGPWYIGNFTIEPGGSELMQNNADYQLDNIVTATLVKDVMSVGLAGTATITATASSEAFIVGAVSLVGTAAITPVGFVTGGVGALASLVGSAIVTPKPTKGVTENGAVSLVGTASTDLDQYSGTIANFSQEHFRWREDDGGEADATWVYATDQQRFLDFDALGRLRFGITNTTTSKPFDFETLSFEARVNDGAWEDIAVLHGETSLPKPSFLIDHTIHINDFSDSELQFAGNVHVFEDDDGNLRMFYTSQIGTDYFIRHRKSIDGGVTWGTFATFPYSNSALYPGEPMTLAQAEMFQKANGDLVVIGWIHIGKTGYVSWTTWLWKSTNGGSTWTEVGVVTPQTSLWWYPYWGAIMDSNEDFWVYTSRREVQGGENWIAEVFHSSNDGSSWNKGFQRDRNYGLHMFENPQNLGNVIIDDYAATYQPGNYLTRFSWDGGDGTTVELSKGSQITPNEGDYDYSMLFPTGHIGSGGLPEREAYLPLEKIGGNVQSVRHYSLDWSTVFHEQDSFEHDHWDYPQPDSNWFLNPLQKTWYNTLFNGIVMYGRVFDANVNGFSFHDHNRQLKNWFADNYAADAITFGTGAGTSDYGAQTHFHAISRKIYSSHLVWLDSVRQIRITQLVIEDGTTALKVSDEGRHTTQQITSGSFLAVNYGVSLFGTVGHKERTLAPGESFEIETYVKVNSSLVNFGDTVCFRVKGCDSYARIPCLYMAFEAADITGEASITATGSVDGPAASITGEATIVATAGLEKYGKTSLSCSAVTASAAQASAVLTPLALCSKEVSVSLLGTATVETESQSVVKGKASLSSVATVVFGTPVIEVACKVSLVGVSNLTPHGARTRSYNNSKSSAGR